MRTVIASFAALLLLGVIPDVAGVWTPGASAQTGFEENIRVVQQRTFLRRGRVEVAPYFALSTNETLFLHLAAGGSLNYHILENLFIGASGVKYFSQETDLFQDVQDHFRVYPEKWELDWYAGGHVAWAFLYGKFILVNSLIVHYDAYVIAGMGVTRTSLSDTAITGNFGVGSRIFLTDWLTFNLEVRDYLFQEDFKAGSRIVNNVMFQAGFSVFIPFGFDYRYPK
jgi:outer membrane beta-barrel protein